MKPPFIYALFDPIEPERIRYVGMTMTNPKRPYDHGIDAKKKLTDTRHVFNWIRKLQAEGRDYSVLVLKELPRCASFEEVCKAERESIGYLKKQGHSLTNGNEGGAGSFNPSPETRNKMRARRLGQKLSDVTKERLSEAGKRHHKAHPEQREKQRLTSVGNKYAVGCKSFLGITHDADARAKMSKAWTPERRAAQAERNKLLAKRSLSERAAAARAIANRLVRLAARVSSDP